MVISYIGLGSNIARASSSPKEQLEIAVDAISVHPKISLEKISSFYQSSPIGPKDQPDYINAVVKIKTDLDAITLLRYLQEIENNNGRERKYRWGPRTLDLDILTFGDQTIRTEYLTVPHLEMENRAFVLRPLLEIDPNFQPLSGHSSAALLEKCTDQGIVKRLRGPIV